jgi:hypothetical protein
MLEIKIPKKMYGPLASVRDAISRGESDPRFSSERHVWLGRPNHIWYSHYSQMQMQMAIADRKWCDYVVYAVEEEEIYIERIPFNKAYWEWLLRYILSFCDKYLSETPIYTPIC